MCRLMKQTPITEQQLATWSEGFNSCPLRQMAMLALSKTDLNTVTYSPKNAFASSR